MTTKYTYAVLDWKSMLQRTILEIWENLNIIVFSNSIILERSLHWAVVLSKHLHICLGEKKHNVCNSPQILPALVHMGCCNTIDWMTYKLQKSISHSSRVQKSKIIMHVQMRALFQVVYFSLYPQRGKGQGSFVGVSF